MYDNLQLKVLQTTCFMENNGERIMVIFLKYQISPFK